MDMSCERKSWYGILVVERKNIWIMDESDSFWEIFFCSKKWDICIIWPPFAESDECESIEFHVVIIQYMDSEIFEDIF